MSKTITQEDAIKEFRSLKIDGWKVSGKQLPNQHSKNREDDIAGGGQAYILVIKHEDGREGVWRRFKSTSDTARKRFFREVEALTNPKFKHPNIVEILDYSRDKRAPWYISKLGCSFEDYWKKQRDTYKHDPESLLKLALSIVRQLLDGLGPLHQEKIVHRDIKPDNIIISEPDVPVLIDFGLVYVDDEEGRLTSEDSAVGNARFSPDVMMNRMNKIVPWLDIFQISQLLIWMVSETPKKNRWQRPLDWRWVNYDKRLSDNSALSIRALTAQCSEESTSPKDATELSALINNLFVTPGKFTGARVDSTKIAKGVSKGMATQALKIAEDTKAINSSYVPVKRIYKSLTAEIENIYSELVSDATPVSKASYSMESFYEELMGTSRPNQKSLYRLTLGEQESHQFHFEIFCHVYTPNNAPKSDRRLPETSNIFVFALTLHSHLHSESFPRRLNFLTYERTGELILRDENMVRGEEINISKLGEMVSAWISDESAWGAIQGDR